MSTGVRSSPTADNDVGDYEVVDLGYGRLDDSGHASDIEPLLLIEPAADPRRADRPGLDAPSRQRVALVLVLTFVFGLVTGILASRAHQEGGPDVPLALELGSATPEGAVVRLGASFGVTSVAVPIHNAGSEDVTVHSFSFPGWRQEQFGSAREPVTVAVGQTETVTTGADLDCARPRPTTPTMVEVRLRTDDLGMISLPVPLSEPARELAARWEQFCAGNR